MKSIKATEGLQSISRADSIILENSPTIIAEAEQRPGTLIVVSNAPNHHDNSSTTNANHPTPTPPAIPSGTSSRDIASTSSAAPASTGTSRDSCDESYSYKGYSCNGNFDVVNTLVIGTNGCGDRAVAIYRAPGLGDAFDASLPKMPYHKTGQKSPKAMSHRQIPR